MTFGSIANGAFGDALDVCVAMLDDKFRPWFEQEARDVARCVSHVDETFIQLSVAVRMIMSLTTVERMIIY